MLVMKRKTFRSRPGLFWTRRGVLEDHERIRSQAEDFSNAVGVAQVVSVTEWFHFGDFVVSVWYREEAEGNSQPAKDAMGEV